MARQRPRDQRRFVFTKAQLRCEVDWCEVTITNVSASGLMVKSPRIPPVNSTVEIRRRGVCITGEVVWATRTRFGVRTSEPIDIDALLAESGVQVRNAELAKPTGMARLWHWRRSKE